MQTHAHTALLQAEEVAREQAAQSLKALQGEFEEAKVRGPPTFCVASDGLGQCQRGPKRAPASAGPTGAASSLLAAPFSKRHAPCCCPFTPAGPARPDQGSCTSLLQACLPSPCLRCLLIRPYFASFLQAKLDQIKAAKPKATSTKKASPAAAKAAAPAAEKPAAAAKPAPTEPAKPAAEPAKAAAAAAEPAEPAAAAAEPAKPAKKVAAAAEAAPAAETAEQAAAENGNGHKAEAAAEAEDKEPVMVAAAAAGKEAAAAPKKRGRKKASAKK